MEDTYKNFNIEKLSDQFTGSTRVVRRNLLIASSIAIALSVDGIKFGTLFGIDLKDITSSQLAIGAIALIALYELISFIVYATIDHRSWVLKANSITHNFQADKLNKIREFTSGMVGQLASFRTELNTQYGESVVDATKRLDSVIDEIKNKSNEEIISYAKAVSDLNKHIKIDNYAQLGRIYLLDWGVPIFLGVLSFHRNKGSIWAFVNAVIS